MDKFLKTLAWVFGFAGLVFIIFGTIAALAGGSLFHHNWANYFYPAYHFVVFGIFLLLVLLVNRKDK